MSLNDFFELMFDELVSLLEEEASLTHHHASIIATELMDRIEEKALDKSVKV